MRRVRITTLTVMLVAMVASLSAARLERPAAPTAVVTREIIAVYLGTIGTDSQSGMVPAIRDMKFAVKRQATETGRRFIARGVSLEPSVDDGARHLALFGAFDEVSLGGNWTNSAVVRYLGGSIDSARATSIPQLILLEREVTAGGASLKISPEHEVARFVGVTEISTWVQHGALLPR
ncbi:MAG: hypothetical protein ABI625_06605 [bacterium]